MKNIIDLRIIIACIGILSLFACNEDKGNYNYEMINKVTEIIGIQEDYTVEVGEQLMITPKIETNLNSTDNLDYTWYYKNGSAWNVLQKGKDLDFVIANPIGTPNVTYTCAFEVKNDITDVAYRQVFNIRVSGIFNRGYILLYDKEDEFDMGMIIQNSQNQCIPKYDILASTAPSLQREGVKPYGLNVFADPTAPHPFQSDGSNCSVYLLTDHYTTRLKVSDFSWNSSYDIYNSVEYDSPIYQDYVAAGKTIIPKKMRVSFNIVNGIRKPRIYIFLKEDNGKGNWYLHNISPVYYFFSHPMNAYRTGNSVYDSKRYEPAPFISCGKKMTMFFNQEKNRFCFQSMQFNAATMGTSFFFTKNFTDDSTDHIFNFESSNEGLLYMGERYTDINKMTAFAFLKQSDGTFKYIEYDMPSSTTELVKKDNKLRMCYFDTSTGIDRAKFIAAAPEPNNVFIYYATEDNRVFYADVSGSNAVIREITNDVVSEGYNEITSLKFMIPSTDNKYLCIATYNSSLKNKGGKVDFYEMKSVSSGDISIARHKINEEETIEMSWKNFGKIVDIDYKP